VFVLVSCIESVVEMVFCIALTDEQQRVPRNSDPSATESLSNGSDWNGSSGLTANGNNTSDSLSQDDDLG